MSSHSLISSAVLAAKLSGGQLDVMIVLDIVRDVRRSLDSSKQQQVNTDGKRRKEIRWCLLGDVCRGWVN
jgi:hypothetical protein